MLRLIITLFAVFQATLGFVSNIPSVNKESSLLSGTSAKSPSDLLFSGSYVCDKYASEIQSTNSTDDFPVDLNLYVAVSEDSPADNYTIDLYFKNPYHNSRNSFSILNVSDSKSVLESYNPVLISTQPDFGVEFKFNFAKGLLCQFLYEFTIAYQLERTNSTEKSDKIFLSGSCQENQQNYPEAYDDLVSQGFRCVDYNSGFKYDGGKDWCTRFYPANECCDRYDRDELVSRDSCPASTSLGAPVSTVAGKSVAGKSVATTLVTSTSS